MGQSFPKHKQLPRAEVLRLQRHVSFKEAEIQDWYQEFCHSVQHRSSKQHPYEFCLTRTEFANIYSSVFPGHCAEFAGHVFRTFDRNGDGRVDFREFLIGMSCSGSDNMEKRLDWAFSVYDVKRTGFITLEDMKQIIRAVFKMIGRSVLRHNNVIVSAESMADELFSKMDTDRDQRISWFEFRQGVLQNPTALHILQCSPLGSVSEITDEDDCAFCS